MAIQHPLPNAVGWFELHVSDLKRAKAFYQAVFQRPMEDLALEPGSHRQMCAFATNPTATGASGALVKNTEVGPGVGGTLVYFSCVDCAVEATRAQAYGGKLQQAKTAIGAYGFIAMVQDTEGNTIGLHSTT